MGPVIEGNDKGNALFPTQGVNFVNEDTLTAGNSPITLAVSNGLAQTGNAARNAGRGYLANDGTGDILVSVSVDGTNFWTDFTVKANEKLDLTGAEVNLLRLTHTGTDADFRVNLW
jgi:hypothetical protein